MMGAHDGWSPEALYWVISPIIRDASQSSYLCSALRPWPTSDSGAGMMPGIGHLPSTATLSLWTFEERSLSPFGE